MGGEVRQCGICVREWSKVLARTRRAKAGWSYFRNSR